MKYYIMDEKFGSLTGEVFETEQDALDAIIAHYGYWDYDEVFIFEYDPDEYAEEFGEVDA